MLLAPSRNKKKTGKNTNTKKKKKDTPNTAPHTGLQKKK